MSDRIDVAVKIDERRRDRTENAVIAALAARPRSHTVPAARSWPKWLLVVPATGAVIAAIVVSRGGNAEPQTAMAPSLVTTPIGGSSRFTVGDAIVDAGGDTSVTVAPGPADTTLTLTRGKIDCEVPPKRDRLPFRVVAGDVLVQVVGTRFAVDRTGSAIRVDVTRGKVSVTARGVQRFLVAGESWSSEPTAEPKPITEGDAKRTDDDPKPPVIDAPKPAPADTPVADAPKPAPADTPVAKPPVVDPNAARKFGESRSAAFQAAQRLEAKDSAAAAKAYRALADGNDRWAALALMNLAELHATSTPDVALRELAELQQRFPTSGNAEDAAWLRIEILRTTGRTDDARRAASVYVRTYPHGTYVRQATRLLAP